MLYLFAALALLAADDVDATATKDSGQLYTDHKGHYLTYVGADDLYVFYGDGRTFYLVRYKQWSHDNGSGAFDVGFIDPRYPAGSGGNFVRDASGAVQVACGKRTTVLTEMKGDKARAMLAAAAYKRTLQAYSSYALARDDHGKYYYVDHGRFEDTSSVFRVFVGPRGNMKPEKLTNIVHDSGGDIFATPTGELRLILDKDKAEWVKGDKRAPLTLLPAEDNAQVIYNDLGVYRNMRLGTPCDDM